MSFKFPFTFQLIIETKEYRTFDRISPWAKYVARRNSGEGLQWLFWHPSDSQMIKVKKYYSIFFF